MSYIEIPAVPGTAESRLSALKESRQLLKGEPKTTSPAIFGGGATEPGAVAGSTELINLATYIETGHAYADLHPTGKRRPKVVNVHATVVAPPGIDTADLEHFLHHVENGDFSEFVQDLIKDRPKPPTMADEKEAREAEGLPTEDDTEK
jgi:hypothetical protein